MGLPLILAAIVGFLPPAMLPQAQSRIFTDQGTLHPNRGACAAADINNSGEVGGTSTIPAAARGARVLLQAVDFASGQKSALVDLILR